MAISNLCSPLKVTYVSDNMYSRSSYTLWLKFGVLRAFISICIVNFLLTFCKFCNLGHIYLWLKLSHFTCLKMPHLLSWILEND